MKTNTSSSRCSELIFSDLCCETSKGKKILHHISGKFAGGALIAILGSSGSGKTTLLNTLSGYRVQNASCSTLQLDDTDITFDDLASISCYLTQDIHLNDLLSVEENMRFAADFKLGTTSQDAKTAIISELLDSFGLSSARATRAGNLSGGERKRLALALEMISDPRIIYLDEPTTGLDISTTHQILEYLKKITTTGKTVICTIHQVSAKHFDLFDLAYVIADGRCAYHGRPQDLVQFLDTCRMPCNIYHSPVEYLIELCSGDLGTENVGHLVKTSQNGCAYAEQHSKQAKLQPIASKFAFYHNVTWNYQLRTVLRREFTKISRNLFLVPLRIFGSNLVSFFIGLLFWNFANDASKTLFNYQFCLAVTINVLLTGVMYPILSFPSEMELVKRELYNRYYTLLQYYLSIFFLDLPVFLLSISTSTMLAWYMNGQPMDMQRILVYQLVMLTFGCVINAIGFFFGTLNIPIRTALVGVSVSQLPIVLISGYGMLFQDMYWFLERLGRAFYLRNAVQGCLVAIFGLSPRELTCPEEEEYCFFKEPHQFLKFLGVDPYDYASCVYVLFMWLLVIRFATYYTMRYRLSL